MSRKRSGWNCVTNTCSGTVPTYDARDGKFRKVEVKLVKVDKLPKLKSRARGGYYAPTQ